jgi:hypothetical protein
VLNYHRYADILLTRRLKEDAFTRINSQEFTFVLYASGEYSRILEREWER